MRESITRNRLLKLDRIGDLVNENLNSNSCVLFFLSNKPCFEIASYPPQSIRDIVLNRLSQILTYIMDRKIYYKEIYVGSYKTRRILFSKKAVSKSKMTTKEYGLLLGIPKCCVEKYVQEDNGKGLSYKSCERYFQQLKDLKKKDKFGIHYKPNESGYLAYGFVPCSPECPNALSLLKKYKRAEKFSLYKK